jgi:hypothetical protein
LYVNLHQKSKSWKIKNLPTRNCDKIPRKSAYFIYFTPHK